MPYCRCRNHTIPGPHMDVDCPLYDPNDPRISKGLPPYARDPDRQPVISRASDPHVHNFGDARCFTPLTEAYPCVETARALLARYAETVKEQAEHANGLSAQMDDLRKELRHVAEKVGDAARTLHAEGGDRYEAGDHRQGRLLYETEGVLREAVVRLHVLSFGEA